MNAFTRTISLSSSHILGLDSAGPLFTTPFDFGTDERLDPTDAKYVQCVYTNNGALGTYIGCGLGNFIMNGGLFQPGCFGPLCSHSRAFAYFTESLNPNHKFAADRCETFIKNLFLEFIGKRCSYEFDQLGIHSARKSGNYFVRTNDLPPFARGIEAINDNTNATSTD